MRVHHLNCGCMCPLGGALFDGLSRGLTACLVCHCLLIETDANGLVLVDTGFGRRDVAQPERLSAFFRYFNNIKLENRYTALDQIERLGFKASDVRHILLTHLDFDHAGGLQDFPAARVHLMREEVDVARASRGWLGQRRFCRPQWDGITGWELYAQGGENWFGFESVRAVLGAEQEDIYLVPLRGHTAGHAGVAVRSSDGWLLLAGDAYFYRGEVYQPERHCTPGLRLYQRMMDTDHQARVNNQDRLRRLSVTRGADLRIFCSHDAKELEQAQARLA